MFLPLSAPQVAHANVGQGVAMICKVPSWRSEFKDSQTVSMQMLLNAPYTNFKCGL